MIRRGTWFLLVLLLSLIGLSVYLRDRQAKELVSATPTTSMAPLFDGGDGAPTLIRVESAFGVVVQFARDQSGKWVLNAPEEAEADQAAAEAAATQVGALRVLSTVKLGADIIGLDRPEYTLAVEFGDSVKHNLHIGSITPIQDGYYTQLDDGQYQVVDKFGLEKLIGLLTSPPYFATPTPLAPPTPAVSETSSSEAATAMPAESTAATSAADQVTATVSP
ncbi:MAG: DUF4340 domain-containing protein [Chloroflexota bacterium]